MIICPNTPKFSRWSMSHAILSLSELAGRWKSIANMRPLPRTSATNGQVGASFFSSAIA